MHMKYKLLAMGLAGITVSLAPNSSHASDRKNYSATGCAVATYWSSTLSVGTSTYQYLRDGFLENRTVLQTLKLDCQVPQDNTGACYTDFDVEVDDRSDEDAVFCRPFSRNTLTGDTLWYAERNSGSSFTGFKNLDWPEATSCYTGQHSAYHLQCTLPKSLGPTTSTRIFGYGMTEP